MSRGSGKNVEEGQRGKKVAAGRMEKDARLHERPERGTS